MRARQVFTSFWVIGGVLTLARIFILIFSEANLGPDEAQYWYWSRDLAYGYFSKPPLIAWAIGLTTGVFGNDEWAVRLAAPLFHFGAAAFLYLTARLLFDQRVAFWTGLAWMTLPGVILSSFLITTDAPLLFFWSGGLYFLARLAAAQTPSISDFAFLGGMIGLGFLSKYAMSYFLIAFGVAAIISPDFRRKLLKPGLALSAVLAAAIVLPNILWNAQHDFQTLSHTAANADWGSDLFKPQKLLSFLGAQFGVAGVIPFAVLIYILARRRFSALTANSPNLSMALLAFALTPLAIVSVQAFISRAHANWAAAAYPAAVMLMTAFLFHVRKGWLAKASVYFHTLIFAVFAIGITNLSIADHVGLSKSVKEIRGWEAQTNAIVSLSAGFDAIVIDDRPLVGEMLYYQKDQPIEFAAIDPNAHTDNHYEAFIAFDPSRHKRVLFVTTRNDAAHVDYRFDNIKLLGPQTKKLGEGVERTYHLFDISGYHPPGASSR